MKELILAMIISMLVTYPAYGNDLTEIPEEKEVINLELEIVETTEASLLSKFEDAKNTVMECKIKYTIATVNIRKEPCTDSDILGKSKVNTTFEVVAEIDGWSMVTTEDGYAFMKSDWFANEPVAVSSYTEEDLEVLTRILTGECHNYPTEEQLYVGSVVLNRVKSKHYPNTIKSVAFQKGQYACTWDGNYYRKPTEENRKNAKWLLENGSVLPENVVYQSGGKQGSGVYLKTKYHYYCYR